MPTRQILLVEDDQETLSDLAESFRQYVGTYGEETETYAVTTSRTRDEGYELGRDMRDTLHGAVVDSKLPIDSAALRTTTRDTYAGIWIIRQWRSDGILFPTILTTGYVDQYEELARRVVGEGAATFFVQKKYEAEAEIVLPMQNLIRIADPPPPPPPPGKLAVGLYVLEIEIRRLLVINKMVKLTPTETRLLELFMLNDGKLLTVNRLCAHIKRPTKNTPTKGTLERHISYLKDKFEQANIRPFPIQNIPAEPYARDGTSGYHGQFSVKAIQSG